jgi:hypothetical protein
MIKNGMQLMRLELALLHEIHHARNASESKGAVGDDRNRRVKFQPRVRRQFHWMADVDWRNQGKSLQQKNERRGERAHEREPIGRPDQHVDKGNRPGEEYKYLKQVRQRAASQRMPANEQKYRLKNEAKSDRKKTKPARLKSPRAQRQDRPHDCGEKTKRRDDEQISIHREG